ncbi:hypothetical protein JTE90_010864 [Oedothorax gibbosus]|uniref:Reverse transcriptase/retrotransposon-derived protein RNase H-like domain-containing protein n=1 Tax=Oedothorax gibbosus TaxID=931172 RepID=A0AAV6V5S2_9ARAC|nr:hypothetical protein JTE90_010864 [Oedothorax gibbosus]
MPSYSDVEAAEISDPIVYTRMIASHLEANQRKKLKDLLENFQDSFHRGPRKQTPKINVKHKIDTGNHTAVSQRPYRATGVSARVIRDFCSRAKPLQELLKGGSKFYWKAESFDDLKKALTSRPVLALFDENSPTELHTDASRYGIGGAVLVQQQKGKERVIANGPCLKQKGTIRQLNANAWQLYGQ